MTAAYAVLEQLISNNADETERLMPHAAFWVFQLKKLPSMILQADISQPSRAGIGRLLCGIRIMYSSFLWRLFHMCSSY
jgi:hypothetical protein